jgi:hypothetical protein
MTNPNRLQEGRDMASTFSKVQLLAIESVPIVSASFNEIALDLSSSLVSPAVDLKY